MALGRKSWLFCGSDRGGVRAAAMYTLIGTAKLNDVDPQAWLADGRDKGPVVGRHPLVVGRDVAEQRGMEHELPDKLAHVARKHRAGDFEAGRRRAAPGAQDQPLAAAGEVGSAA